jgi:putative phosphoesterase
MKIAILSDTHDAVGSARTALREIRARGIDTVIHCGDWTRVVIAQQFDALRVIGVSGNVDGDPEALGAALRALGEGNWFGPLFEGEIGGAWVGVLHGHQPGEIERLARTRRFDYLFHGHTHRRRDERIGATRVINPGALGGARHESRSFCVLDLATGAAQSVTVSEW